MPRMCYMQRKKYVFNYCLEVSLLSDKSQRKSGSEFQALGPATESAWRPNLVRWCRGMMSWCWLAKRNCWRLATLVVDLQQFTLPCRHRWTVTPKYHHHQLNPAKSEILWCASARCQHQIPTGPVRIGNTTVFPVSQVRDLGVYLDADVIMKAHVTATVRACFSALRQIQSVRRSPPRHATPCWLWLELWWSPR